MRRRQTAYLGLIVSALALGAFIVLASMFKQDSFLQRDLAFTQRIHAGEESALAPVFDIVTDAGKSMLILVVLEVATLLWVRRYVAELVAWLGTITGGFALNLVLRALLQGSRPYLEDTTIHPTKHRVSERACYDVADYLWAADLRTTQPAHAASVAARQQRTNRAGVADRL